MEGLAGDIPILVLFLFLTLHLPLKLGVLGALSSVLSIGGGWGVRFYFEAILRGMK